MGAMSFSYNVNNQKPNAAGKVAEASSRDGDGADGASEPFFAETARNDGTNPSGDANAIAESNAATGPPNLNGDPPSAAPTATGDATE
jgi:hypothetical protein